MNSYALMRDALTQRVPPGGSTAQHQHAAIEWLCEQLDEAKGRLEQLEKVAHAPYDFTHLVDRLDLVTRSQQDLITRIEQLEANAAPPEELDPVAPFGRCEHCNGPLGKVFLNLDGKKVCRVGCFGNAATAACSVDGRGVHDLRGTPSCVRCGFTPKLTAPVGVYEGDGHPAARAKSYENVEIIVYPAREEHRYLPGFTAADAAAMVTTAGRYEPESEDGS